MGGPLEHHVLAALLALWPGLAHAERPVFGVALEGLPEAQELADLRQRLGLDIGLVNVYLQWPAEPGDEAVGAFPTRTAFAAASINATLCVTWEPMFLRAGQETVIDAEALLDGRYDGYIQRFGRKARAWGGLVIIRFAHEMNLARYHWGGTPEEYGPQSPQRYLDMFRHVVRTLRETGANNLRFAFCPNAEPDPAAPWNTVEAYYPGDDVVDVLGMDGYNWGTSRTAREHGWQSGWRGFADIFGGVFQALRALAPEKPVYVFETASAAQGGDKGQWVAETARTAREWGLAGVVWFQANKEVDWRLGDASRTWGHTSD